ncbi:MAG: hypothetical protein WCS31_06065 [Verrucomicrobiae bacterium]
MSRVTAILFLLLGGVGFAPSRGETANQEAPGGSDLSPKPPSGGKLLGDLGLGVPSFDPANELVTWNGSTWNITNERLFASLFERYLNAPEESKLTVLEYEKLLLKIHDLLSPSNVSVPNIDQAFRLLSLAAGFEMDGNISDVLRGQIYASWMAKNEIARLQSASSTLQTERNRLEWNLKMAAQANRMQTVRSGAANAVLDEANRKSVQEATIEPIAKRLLEVETLLKKKDLDKEYSLSQARTDFQVIIVQFFLQRRFEHVPIAIDFYRAIFNDGASQVKLGDEAMSLFSKTMGNPPTLATLDAAAREIAQNVRQGEKSIKVMLDHLQIQSASKRLAEAYMLGENMPEMRIHPLESKQKILTFVQKSNRLLAALDVKDYAQAESLLAELQREALDFDPTKPNATIQTSKLSASLHLAKARNAAVSGDKATLEKELQEAAEVWPTNPQLKELAAKIFEQADVGAQALSDFDRLLSQKNYRQIYDDKMRFIAATAMHPDKQEALKKILDDITQIEIAMQRAAEIEKRGDSAGAWESVKTAAKDFSDDTKLNQFLANLTIKAATFVDTIQTGEEYEKNDHPACALTAYLAAQKIYPPSQFAREGILRITKEILPDS